tara:strand:+ start:298 stop:1086 length:789 start_codon:yes stop_codon:yes gene_type:complete
MSYSYGGWEDEFSGLTKENKFSGKPAPKKEPISISGLGSKPKSAPRPRDIINDDENDDSPYDSYLQELGDEIRVATIPGAVASVITEEGGSTPRGDRVKAYLAQLDNVKDDHLQNIITLMNPQNNTDFSKKEAATYDPFKTSHISHLWDNLPSYHFVQDGAENPTDITSENVAGKVVGPTITEVVKGFTTTILPNNNVENNVAPSLDAQKDTDLSGTWETIIKMNKLEFKFDRDQYHFTGGIDRTGKAFIYFLLDDPLRWFR